jgi:hypothetical protein
MKGFWFLGGYCFSLGCLACATTFWCKKNKSFKVLGGVKQEHPCLWAPYHACGFLVKISTTQNERKNYHNVKRK